MPVTRNRKTPFNPKNETEPNRVEPLLKETDLDERYGISEDTAQRLRIAGLGPPCIKFGNTIRYRATDVEAWLTEHTATPSSDAR